MVDAIGGAMMLLGGASMSASSLTLARAAFALRPIERAKMLICDSSAAVVQVMPTDMLALLDQIP